MTAMLKTITLAFAMLAACDQCFAQTVALSIMRLDCAAPLSPLFSPPASPQEKEKVSAEWVGADELAVESWDDETADSRVDPSTAKVYLDGSIVTLTYSHRPVVPDRNKAIATCQSLVKLFFTVSGLARSHYLLRIDGGRGGVQWRDEQHVLRLSSTDSASLQEPGFRNEGAWLFALKFPTRRKRSSAQK